ncbi:hypothetical protein [Erwinia sp. 198]|uniref:hypothetical protein n=1 Tax=Erwinia sp. 198 TaxID=2022746 RepID=UPI0013156721|nr:hypothetical protein [Erwinia sp. 198]
MTKLTKDAAGCQRKAQNGRQKTAGRALRSAEASNGAKAMAPVERRKQQESYGG